MMNQSKYILSILLCVLVSCVVVGCGGDNEGDQQQVVKKAPTSEPRPTAKSVDKVMTELSIDPRIRLAEIDAPRNEPQRIAVLRFFNAILKVDIPIIKSMVSFADQLELDSMMNAGLSTYMDDVSLLELKTGTSPDGRECALGVFEIGMDYQIQVWYYEKSNNSFTFTAAETSPNLVDKLSGDWMINYFVLKDKQIEIANQPDEEISYTLASEITTSGGSRGGDGPQKPPGPDGPTRPGGPKGPGR